VKILFYDEFLDRFNTILEFIAQDKKSAAIKFKQDIQKKITHLKTNPYIYRKSHYKDDTNCRDLTHLGYTVVYCVNNTIIEILDIFKWQKRVSQ